MENINWKAKQSIARSMTYAELEFAYNDCRECVAALGEGPQCGKDASYYRDEASIYWQEMQARQAKARKALDGKADRNWR